MKINKKYSLLGFMFILSFLFNIEFSNADCTLTTASGKNGQCHISESKGYYCGEVQSQVHCIKVKPVITHS